MGIEKFEEALQKSLYDILKEYSLEELQQLDWFTTKGSNLWV